MPNEQRGSASSLATVSLPRSLCCNGVPLEGLQEQTQGSGEVFQLGEGLPGEGVVPLLGHESWEGQVQAVEVSAASF